MPNNYDILPNELRKLGLTKKEAELYLFLLEKTSATVLEISKKLSLSRPTIYRTIENLKRRELVFQDRNKKRSCFFASSPDGLLGILKIQRRRAEEQEREFLRIISILRSKYHLSSNQNEIKNYSRKVLLEDFSSTPENKIYILYGKNYLSDSQALEKIYPQIRKRLGKIEVREIFPEKITSSGFEYVKRRNIYLLNPPDQTLIIAKKIFILEKKQGLHLDEESVASFFRLMFNSLWEKN